jgi:hypothetical protein
MFCFLQAVTPVISSSRETPPAGACSRVQQLLCRGIQALGEEIFDRRYPGFVLGREHKCCIKRLGAWVPTIPLL